MSKRDELKFTIKKSLIVGTATATLGAMSCKQETISNPVPGRNDTGSVAGSDASDAGGDTSEEPDAGPSEDGSETDDAGSDSGATDDVDSDTATDASNG